MSFMTGGRVGSCHTRMDRGHPGVPSKLARLRDSSLNASSRLSCDLVYRVVLPDACELTGTPNAPPGSHPLYWLAQGHDGQLYEWCLGRALLFMHSVHCTQLWTWWSTRSG